MGVCVSRTDWPTFLLKCPLEPVLQALQEGTVTSRQREVTRVTVSKEVAGVEGGALLRKFLGGGFSGRGWRQGTRGLW